MAAKMGERLNCRLFFKILELGIAITCIALIRDYDLEAGSARVSGHLDRHLFSIIIVGGFIICTALLIVGMSSDPTIGTSNMTVLFCLVGAAGFITAGAFFIESYQNASHSKTRDAGLSTGALCVINGALFLLDAVLIFRAR